MLLLENGSSKLERIQGAFISDDEVMKLTLLYSEIAIYSIVLFIFYFIDITSSLNVLSELEDISIFSDDIS